MDWRRLPLACACCAALAASYALELTSLKEGNVSTGEVKLGAWAFYTFSLDRPATLLTVRPAYAVP